MIIYHISLFSNIFEILTLKLKSFFLYSFVNYFELFGNFYFNVRRFSSCAVTNASKHILWCTNAHDIDKRWSINTLSLTKTSISVGTWAEIQRVEKMTWFTRVYFACILFVTSSFISNKGKTCTIYCRKNFTLILGKTILVMKVLTCLGFE